MSDLDKHPLDSYFRENLEAAKVVPPVYAWENLQSAMVQKKKRKALIWWRVAAAAILLITAFSLGYLLSPDESRTPAVAEQEFSMPGSAEDQITEGSLPSPSDNIASSQDDNASGLTQPIEQEIESGNAMIAEGNPETVLTAAHSSTGDENVSATFLTEPGNLTNVMAQNGITEEYSGMPRLSLAQLDIPAHVVDVDARTEYISALLHPFWLRDDVPGDEKEVDDAGWRLGGDIAPLLAFASGSNQDQELASYSATNTEGTTEGGSAQPLMSFSAGLNTALSISRGLWLNAGFNYTRLGQETEDIPLAYDLANNWAPPSPHTVMTNAGDVSLSSEQVASLDPGSSVLGGGPLSSTSVIQYFEYLEFPLLLETYLVDRKVKLSMDAGLSTGVLIRDQAYLMQDGERLDLSGTNGLRPVLFSGMAGLGLRIPLLNSWELNLRPGMRYALTSVNEDASYDYRPWSVSLGTGLTYRLK